jgi:hypothetical protein
MPVSLHIALPFLRAAVIISYYGNLIYMLFALFAIIRLIQRCHESLTAHACANPEILGLCQGWAANAGTCLEEHLSNPAISIKLMQDHHPSGARTQALTVVWSARGTFRFSTMVKLVCDKKTMA